MAVPPAPPPLEQLGPRPFSFYPAIGNIDHNEWLYERATWSEVQVRNTKSGQEIWVPRRLLGEPITAYAGAREMAPSGLPLAPRLQRTASCCRYGQ